MWFNPGGTEMEDEEWNTAFVRSLGVHAERGYDVCDFYSRTDPRRYVPDAGQCTPRGREISYFRAKKRFAGELIIDTPPGGGLSGNPKMCRLLREIRNGSLLFVNAFERGRVVATLGVPSKLDLTTVFRFFPAGNS